MAGISNEEELREEYERITQKLRRGDGVIHVAPDVEKELNQWFVKFVNEYTGLCETLIKTSTSEAAESVARETITVFRNQNTSLTERGIGNFNEPKFMHELAELWRQLVGLKTTFLTVEQNNGWLWPDPVSLEGHDILKMAAAIQRWANNTNNILITNKEAQIELAKKYVEYIRDVARMTKMKPGDTQWNAHITKMKTDIADISWSLPIFVHEHRSALDTASAEIEQSLTEKANNVRLLDSGVIELVQIINDAFESKSESMLQEKQDKIKEKADALDALLSAGSNIDKITNTIKTQLEGKVNMAQSFVELIEVFKESMGMKIAATNVMTKEQFEESCKEEEQKLNTKSKTHSDTIFLELPWDDKNIYPSIESINKSIVGHLREKKQFVDSFRDIILGLLRDLHINRGDGTGQGTFDYEFTKGILADDRIRSDREQIKRTWDEAKKHMDDTEKLTRKSTVDELTSFLEQQTHAQGLMTHNNSGKGQEYDDFVKRLLKLQYDKRVLDDKSAMFDGVQEQLNNTTTELDKVKQENNDLKTKANRVDESDKAAKGAFEKGVSEVCVYLNNPTPATKNAILALLQDATKQEFIKVTEKLQEDIKQAQQAVVDALGMAAGDDRMEVAARLFGMDAAAEARLEAYCNTDAMREALQRAREAKTALERDMQAAAKQLNAYKDAAKRGQFAGFSENIEIKNTRIRKLVNDARLGFIEFDKAKSKNFRTLFDNMMNLLCGTFMSEKKGNRNALPGQFNVLTADQPHEGVQDAYYVKSLIAFLEQTRISHENNNWNEQEIKQESDMMDIPERKNNLKAMISTAEQISSEVKQKSDTQKQEKAQLEAAKKQLEDEKGQLEQDKKTQQEASDAKIQELEEAVKARNKTIETIEKSIETLQNERNALQKQFDVFKTTSETHNMHRNNELENMRQKNAALQQQNGSLNEAYQKMDEENKKIQSEEKALKAQLEQQDKTYEAIKQSNDDLEAELQREIAKCKALEESNNNYDQHTAEVSRLSEEYKKALESTMHATDAALAAIRHGTFNVTTTEGGLTNEKTLEQHITGALEAIQKVRDTIPSYSKWIQGVNNGIMEAKLAFQKIKTDKEDLKNAKTELETIKAQNVSHDAVLRTLEEAKEQLKTETNELKMKLSLKEQEAEHCKSEMTVLREQRAAGLQALQDLQQEKQRLQSEVQQADEDAKAAQETVNTISTEKETLLIQNTRLEAAAWFFIHTRNGMQSTIPHQEIPQLTNILSRGNESQKPQIQLLLTNAIGAAANTKDVDTVMTDQQAGAAGHIVEIVEARFSTLHAQFATPTEALKRFEAIVFFQELHKGVLSFDDQCVLAYACNLVLCLRVLCYDEEKKGNDGKWYDLHQETDKLLAEVDQVLRTDPQTAISSMRALNKRLREHCNKFEHDVVPVVPRSESKLYQDTYARVLERVQKERPKESSDVLTEQLQQTTDQLLKTQKLLQKHTEEEKRIIESAFNEKPLTIFSFAQLLLGGKGDEFIYDTLDAVTHDQYAPLFNRYLNNRHFGVPVEPENTFAPRTDLQHIKMLSVEFYIALKCILEHVRHQSHWKHDSSCRVRLFNEMQLHTCLEIHTYDQTDDENFKFITNSVRDIIRTLKEKYRSTGNVTQGFADTLVKMCTNSLKEITEHMVAKGFSIVNQPFKMDQSDRTNSNISKYVSENHAMFLSHWANSS